MRSYDSVFSSHDEFHRRVEMPHIMKPEEMVGKHKFENIVPEEQSMPRHVYFSKSDFDEHGCSSNCPGCRSILKGIRRQVHSEACRQRTQKALEGTDRLERATAREHEFYEKVLRREDKKRVLDEAEKKERETAKWGTNRRAGNQMRGVRKPKVAEKDWRKPKAAET